MQVRKRIAWNLRQLRVERGYSIEKLAAEAGADPCHVGRIERAERNCSVEFLERLAAVLSHDVADLVAVPPSAQKPRPLRVGRRSRRPR